MSADNGYIKCPRCRADLGTKITLFNILANHRIASVIKQSEMTPSEQDHIYYTPTVDMSMEDLLDKLKLQNVCCRTAALGMISRD